MNKNDEGGKKNEIIASLFEAEYSETYKNIKEIIWWLKEKELEMRKCSDQNNCPFTILLAVNIYPSSISRASLFPIVISRLWNIYYIKYRMKGMSVDIDAYGEAVIEQFSLSWGSLSLHLQHSHTFKVGWGYY